VVTAVGAVTGLMAQSVGLVIVALIVIGAGAGKWISDHRGS
jgi:hypothetical protein